MRHYLRLNLPMDSGMRDFRKDWTDVYKFAIGTQIGLFVQGDEAIYAEVMMYDVPDILDPVEYIVLDVLDTYAEKLSTPAFQEKFCEWLMKHGWEPVE